MLVTGPTGSGKTTTLGVDDRLHQRDAAQAHRDDRGPDRDPARRQVVDRQPARGRHRHRRLPLGAEARAAPGPRRDPRRRDARRRDREDRADRRGDRAPRVLDAAHDQRDRLDQPDHRLLPAARAAPGAHVARRFVARHREPAAGRAPQRRARPGGRDPRRDRPDLRQDRERRRDPRDRADHRRGRVLRHADVRPEPAEPLRARGSSTCARRSRPRRARTTSA